MDYGKVLEELYSLDSSKFKLGLKGIKILLNKLGNPEKKIKCVHVAGTNGKGSVCAMIHSVLKHSGYKTGIYTSPHLKKFNERIKINDKEITDKEVVDYYLRVKRHVTGQTFFEITTAMMFLYFFERKVDFAVIETGLGGRLDATNVINPLVSVITNISLEHTKILGKTLEKIAYEKACIIKNNIPAVTGAEGIALKTIRNFANKKNAPLTTIKENNKSLIVALNDNISELKSGKKMDLDANKKINFDYNKKTHFNLKPAKNNSNIKKDMGLGENNLQKTIKIVKKYDKKNNSWQFDFNDCKSLALGRLRGEFQVKNAVIAVTVVEILNNFYNLNIGYGNIANGLKNAKWRGRFEFSGKNILMDCAHNPDGFEALFNEISRLRYDKLIVVAGFSNDKNMKGISKIVKAKADKLILTKADNERAAEIKDIKKYFDNPIIINKPKKAFEYAKKIRGKGDLVLATGSIYMVGEII